MQMMESNPQSIKDKIDRKFRMQYKKTRNNQSKKGEETATKNDNFVDRVTPHIGKHNKSIDEGKLLTDEVIESARFIIENIQSDNISDVIQNFKHKDYLCRLVKHIIATQLGGWSDNGKMYINESGRASSKDRWDLDNDGYLHPKGMKRVVFDLDKLHNLRDILEKYVK